MPLPYLIFGTASLAGNYGISNPRHESNDSRTSDLVDTAQKIGISYFDTAPVYGNAETLLGEHLDKAYKSKIDSKISTADCYTYESILSSIELSLNRLQVDELNVLYLHDEMVLFQENSDNLIDNLKKIRNEGYFKKIGVSVYTLEQIQKIHKFFPEVEVFQVPENICDRRLKNNNFMEELMTEGKEFVVRSIFLQGLLLMNLAEIPSRMETAKPAIESLNGFALRENRSLPDLCLAYAMNLKWCSGVIVSAFTSQQLIQTMEFSSSLPLNWETEVKVIPDEWIDPRKW